MRSDATAGWVMDTAHCNVRERSVIVAGMHDGRSKAMHASVYTENLLGGR